MNLRLSAVAAGLAACAAGAALAQSGASRIAFPQDFERGVLYATVDRHDIKQYRELWATRPAVEAVKAGKPIPHGTVLTLVQYKAKVDDKGVPLRDASGRFQKGDLVAYTVMEKRAGWGSEYPEDVRNGEWEYQVFTAERKVNEKANLKGCFQCHKPHAGQDFVISLARLAGTAPAQKLAAHKGPDSVAIANFVFGPDRLEVPKGTYVRWTNTDGSPHQVAVGGPAGVRSDVMLPGQAAFMKFDAPGSYEYICGLHPGMKGRIDVK